MLKAFDILVAFELLPERGTESSQNRLVKCINLDRLCGTPGRILLFVIRTCILRSNLGNLLRFRGCGTHANHRCTFRLWRRHIYTTRYKMEAVPSDQIQNCCKCLLFVHVGEDFALYRGCYLRAGHMHGLRGDRTMWIVSKVVELLVELGLFETMQSCDWSWLFTINYTFGFGIGSAIQVCAQISNYRN